MSEKPQPICRLGNGTQVNSQDNRIPLLLIQSACLFDRLVCFQSAYSFDQLVCFLLHPMFPVKTPSLFIHCIHIGKKRLILATEFFFYAFQQLARNLFPPVFRQYRHRIQEIALWRFVLLRVYLDRPRPSLFIKVAILTKKEISLAI